MYSTLGRKYFLPKSQFRQEQYVQMSLKNGGLTIHTEIIKTKLDCSRLLQRKFFHKLISNLNLDLNFA